MSSAGPVAPTATAACQLRPLPLGAVRITGGFWAARQLTNRLDLLRTHPADHRWLEAAAWEYAREPADDLRREVTAAARRGDPGHLIRAAIARVRGTGDRELLQTAVEVADRLVAHPRRAVDCHPVLAMALVELFRQTDNHRYLELAGRVVDAGDPTVSGYLVAGAVDVATERDDRERLDALADLAPDPAPVGAGVQWAWRMLLATGEPSYADTADRLLRDGFARGDPDGMVLLSSLDNYLATTDADGVQLHLYADAEVTARLRDGPIRLTVQADDARIRVRVAEAPRREWTLSMRVPAAALLTVCGEPPQPTCPGTYAEVVRTWSPGDVVDLVLR
ncbi:MAG TPA: beta-L-arabinofuranosidase domain-containing protein [Asanoa sp.]|nr:beta-L-arabinofuranosidase domain-containing protein [Asanoa sp.]